MIRETPGQPMPATGAGPACIVPDGAPDWVTSERLTKTLAVWQPNYEEVLTVDGLLFYKVDRAARNLFDYVELERLESEYQVPFISISQQTENNPAGRMNCRLVDATRCPAIRKPFDVPVEGLILKESGG